ncbi:hypothetical protein [Amycolatopsis sp. NPDC003731]
MKKVGGILAVSLVVLVACDPAPMTPDEPLDALGFVARTDAIQLPVVDRAVYDGPSTLVPDGACVLGFTAYSWATSSRVASTWVGKEDCTRLVLDRTPEQAATGFTATAAVPGPDGSVIGLGPAFSRRDRSGAVVPLFQPESDRRAVALARAGRNLVGVGTGQPSGRPQPVAWVSGDEGRTAHEITLPTDLPGYWEPRAIAAEGDRVLVAGSAGTAARVWSSGDAGETWTVSDVPVRGSELVVTTVLRTGGKWLLAGISAAGPLVVTGEPGDWQLEAPTALGDGRISGGTVDAAGKPVLIGERSEKSWAGSSRSCSIVWTLDAGGWQRGELGCPPDPVSAAARLADGRVLLAGSRTLWIRP